VAGLFFFGGEDPNPLVPDMSQPVYTDSLIYLMYVLLGITIVITLAAAVYQFVMNFIDSPKAAIKSLASIIVLVGLLIVTWAAGSEQALVMPGYDGAENVPFWLKLTDMFLYTIYIMMAVLILLILGFGISKKFK
jgi:ABC-type Fe3+ transport system permease subunit